MKLEAICPAAAARRKILVTFKEAASKVQTIFSYDNLKGGDLGLLSLKQSVGKKSLKDDERRFKQNYTFKVEKIRKVAFNFWVDDSAAFCLNCLLVWPSALSAVQTHFSCREDREASTYFFFPSFLSEFCCRIHRRRSCCQSVYLDFGWTLAAAAVILSKTHLWSSWPPQKRKSNEKKNVFWSPKIGRNYLHESG